MTNRDESAHMLLSPGEVARIFQVDTKTVARWADLGRLTVFRTLGNHRRYAEREVRALLAATEVPSIGKPYLT